jgi:hypothetical protein
MNAEATILALLLLLLPGLAEAARQDFPPGNYSTGPVSPVKLQTFTLQLDRVFWTDPGTSITATYFVTENGSTYSFVAGFTAVGATGRPLDVTSLTIDIPTTPNPQRRYRVDFVVAGGTVRTEALVK